MNLFVNSCTILRWGDREASAANNFEPVADFAPLCSGVRYNLQIQSGSEATTVAGQQVTFSAVGYFPIGTSLQAKPGHAENDQIKDDVSCAVYQVVAVYDQVGRGRFLKALLRAV